MTPGAGIRIMVDLFNTDSVAHPYRCCDLLVCTHATVHMNIAHCDSHAVTCSRPLRHHVRFVRVRRVITSSVT